MCRCTPTCCDLELQIETSCTVYIILLTETSCEVQYYYDSTFYNNVFSALDLVNEHSCVQYVL